MNRDNAQRRVDRIGAFFAELEELEQDGILVLPSDGERESAHISNRSSPNSPPTSISIPAEWKSKCLWEFRIYSSTSSCAASNVATSSE